MSFRSSAILLLALLAISACSDDSSGTGPVPTKPLWPLAVGNYWVLEYEDFYNGKSEGARLDTIKIVGMYLDNTGTEWYRSNEGSNVAIVGYRNTVHGLEQSFGSITIRFRYPASVGDTAVFQTNDEPLHVTVLNTDTTVTVKAGTFQCVKYGLGDAAKIKNIVYLAPGIGLVRKESVTTSSNSQSVGSLVAYHLE